MAFDYKLVLPPVGQPDSHILREMFDDVKGYINDELVLLTGDQTITGDIAVVGNPFTVRSAEATTEIAIDNTATDGDPYLSWQLSGTRLFSLGVDDGDGDVLKLGTTAIGTGTMLKATAAGEINFPLQPSFLAIAGSDLNATGDGSLSTVTFGTEIFDQGGDFANSVFTAPVTGHYLLTTNVLINQLTSAHTEIELRIVTSNRTYSSIWNVGTYGYSRITIPMFVVADMDMNDTAIVQIVVSGGTKVVDITAGSTFSGSLIN